MKVDSLDINGVLKVERLSSLPEWNSGYLGRVVYNTSDDTLYVGKSTGWSVVGGSSYSPRPDWDSYSDNVAEVFTINQLYPNLVNHSGSFYVRLAPIDLITAVRGGAEPIQYSIRLSTENYSVESEDPSVPYVDLDDRYYGRLENVYVRIRNNTGSVAESYSIISIQDINEIRPLVWSYFDTHSSITLSEERLLATNTTDDGMYHRAYANCYGYGYLTRKKYYWEYTIVSSGNMRVGIAYNTSSTYVTYYVGQDYYSYGYDSATGNTYYNGSGSSYGNTFTTGDIIGVAFNAETAEIWFSKNGVWQNSGDPVTRTNPAFTGIYTFVPQYPCVSLTGTSAIRVNFGATPFSYTPPSGYTERLI